MVVPDRLGGVKDLIENEKPGRPPCLGVLSDTLAPSASCKWIIPYASRKSRWQVYAAFVGENYINAKKFIPDGYGLGALEDVAPAIIINARVLRCKALGNETPFGLDHLERQSNVTNPMFPGWPSRMLVLLLDTRKILFVCANCDDEASNHQSHPQVQFPLPVAPHASVEYNKHLAVDPFSRAVAVSAAHDYFMILILKSASGSSSSRATGKIENPVRDQTRSIFVDGAILAMDFLYPSSLDENLVILQLLVLSRENQLLGCCYYWDLKHDSAKYRSISRELAHKSSTVPGVSSSRSEDSLLLAPIRRPASFLFSSGQGLRLCDNFLSDNSPGSTGPILFPSAPGASWTRVPRSEEFLLECDEIFVMGKSRTCLISVRVSRQGDVSVRCDCSIPFTVDSITGLASVSEDTPSGDILGVVGSSGRTALVFVSTSPRTDAAVVIQSFAGRLPVTDSVVINSSGTRAFNPSTHRACGSRNRILTCSSEQGFCGSLVEHHYGYPAQARWDIEHAGAFTPSMSNIWALSDKDGKMVYVVGSDTSSTVVLTVPHHCIESSLYVPQDQCGFDLETRTLGACVTRQGIFTQVTKLKMNFWIPGENNYRQCYSSSNPMNTINAFASRDYVLHVVTEGHLARSIQLGKVIIVNGEPACVPAAATLSVSWEPVSFLITEIDDKTYLFFGTFCGHLYVYTVDKQTHQLRFLSSARITLEDIEADDRMPTSCASLALLTSKRPHRRRTLVCGLTSGYVVSFELVAGKNDSIASGLVQDTPSKVGNYAIRFGVTSKAGQSSTLCWSDSHIWDIRLVDGESHNKCSLSAILLDIPDELPRRDSVIGANLVDTSTVEEQPARESFVIVTSMHISLHHLSGFAQNVRRNMSLPLKPERMIYSSYLQKLLVAGTALSDKVVCPSICYIDPDHTTAINPPTPQTFLSPRDYLDETNKVITAIMEWNMLFKSSKHSFVVMASLEYGEHDKPRGCLHFVKTALDSQECGGLRAEIKQQMSFDKPIAAMCPYDQSRFIIGYGNLVRFLRFDESKRFILGKPRKIESDVITLSSADDLIYVSTKRNSVVVLQETSSTIPEGINTLELARITYHNEPCLSHLVLDDPGGLLVASHAGGKISGYSSRVHTFSEMRLLPEVFSLNMPIPSPRLHKVESYGLPWMFYGVTTVDSIHRFRPLREAEWRMLKFLDNMTSSSSMILREKPHDIAGTATNLACELLFAPLFIPMGRADSLHINGDHIRQVILSGGTDYISDVFSCCLQNLDQNIMALVWNKLLQIIAELIGHVDENNCIPRLVDWLRDYLTVWI